jgi:hypothetical protein
MSNISDTDVNNILNDFFNTLPWYNVFQTDFQKLNDLQKVYADNGSKDFKQLYAFGIKNYPDLPVVCDYFLQNYNSFIKADLITDTKILNTDINQFFVFFDTIKSTIRTQISNMQDFINAEYKKAQYILWSEPSLRSKSKADDEADLLKSIGNDYTQYDFTSLNSYISSLKSAYANLISVINSKYDLYNNLSNTIGSFLTNISSIQRDIGSRSKYTNIISKIPFLTKQTANLNNLLTNFITNSNSFLTQLQTAIVPDKTAIDNYNINYKNILNQYNNIVNYINSNSYIDSNGWIQPESFLNKFYNNLIPNIFRGAK